MNQFYFEAWERDGFPEDANGNAVINRNTIETLHKEKVNNHVNHFTNFGRIRVGQINQPTEPEPF